MIAVVADDFTGAAEIAGVGLRYGLASEVQTVVNPDSKADLVVIDTDSRSRTPAEAANEVEKVLKELQKTCPEWIYKKVDSVLRGNVLAELRSMLTLLAKQKVLLVPANPSWGRTITEGRYFINGRPLDKTDFSLDPEHPVTSSDVRELLGPLYPLPVRILRPDQSIIAAGVVVGEAQNKGDLLAWAAKLDEHSVPAGAADFFAAILEVNGFRTKLPEDENDSLGREPKLFVCGSSSEGSREAVEQARAAGVRVCGIPRELLQRDRLINRALEQWADRTLRALKQHGQVILTIDRRATADRALAQRLEHHTASVVENVLSRISIHELCIEGGATASAILRRMQWKRFFPYQEPSPGVVRMRIEGKQELCVTAKPGSYPWPERIWRFT